ncbi:ABC transporter ATP-binding protein [Sporosarcina sp. OR05]|uniref:ABC transporter ATP-binding protein n=1 Tax=Sporosarcina sp. OR05 TaxID=2969819 RepID=UPI00352B2ADE
MVSKSDKTDAIFAKGQDEERGIWKSYFKLIFKAKIPWVWMLIVIAVWIGQAQLTLMLPGYSSKIMTGVIEPNVVYGAVAVIVLGTIMGGVVRYMNNLLNFKIDVRYRSLIWRRLMKSPMGMFDNVKPTEMISRITTDSATISSVLGTWLPSTLATVYTTVGVIAVLFTYDWRLSVAVLLYIPINILFTVYYGKWSYRVNRMTFNRLSKLTSFLSELLMSVPLIKTFVTESKEDLRGQQNLQYYYKANLKRSIVNWIENPVNGVLGILQNLIVIGYGVYLLKAGMIEMTEWVGFFLYVGMLSGTIGVYFMVYIELKNSQGATTRIAQLMDNELEEYDHGIPTDKLTGDITFTDVAFGYGEKEVFTELNFTIPKGKKTAIVGPSGSGKSTVLALLQQFYSPQKGSIQVGETPVSEYTLHSWRNLFSVVDQDSSMISGTVRENMLYGVKRKVSDQEIVEAAEKANALQFIEELEFGFDTYVGEAGSNLSGGQRQRIAIARAFLRDAEILLLDEATASLDSKAEKFVKEAIDKLASQCTAVIISHDLSNVKDADQIILINEGKVNGTGTHEQLLQTNELYQEFVRLHQKPSAQ